MSMRGVPLWAKVIKQILAEVIGRRSTNLAQKGQEREELKNRRMLTL